MVLGLNRDVITKKVFLEKFLFISPYLIPKIDEKILTRSKVIKEKCFLVLGPNRDVITKEFFLEKFLFISPYLIPKFSEKILTRSKVHREK